MMDKWLSRHINKGHSSDNSFTFKYIDGKRYLLHNEEALYIYVLDEAIERMRKLKDESKNIENEFKRLYDLIASKPPLAIQKHIEEQIGILTEAWEIVNLREDKSTNDKRKFSLFGKLQATKKGLNSTAASDANRS